MPCFESFSQGPSADSTEGEQRTLPIPRVGHETQFNLTSCEGGDEAFAEGEQVEALIHEWFLGAEYPCLNNWTCPPLLK